MWQVYKMKFYEFYIVWVPLELWTFFILKLSYNVSMATTTKIDGLSGWPLGTNVPRPHTLFELTVRISP